MLKVLYVLNYAGKAGTERYVQLLIETYLNNSLFYNIFKKDGYISSKWPSLITYRVIEKIINIPVFILRKIYFIIYRVTADSCFFKFIRLVASNASFVLGFAFFAIIITPHEYSYNYIMGSIVFAAFLVLIINKSMNNDTNLSIKDLSIYFVIFALSVLISAAFSIFPNLSIRDLLLYLICFSCIIIITNTIKTEKDFSNIIEMILIGVSITGIYGIYQKISGIQINPSQIDLSLNAEVGSRAYSNMANPNNLAQVYVLFVPFYLSVITSSKTIHKKLIFFMLCIPVIVTLLITASRSGWIGLAVAVVIFLYYKNKRVLPFFIAGGLLSILFLPQSMYVRLTTIFNLSDSSTSYRFLIMESILPALKDFWLTGTGLGAKTFMKIIGNYELLTIVVPPHSHNHFLQLWIELGILGMFAFAGFVINLLKRGIKSIKKSKNNYFKDMTIAGISAIIGIIIISIAEYIWYYPRVMMLFYIVTGLLIVSIRLSCLDTVQ